MPKDLLDSQPKDLIGGEDIKPIEQSAPESSGSLLDSLLGTAPQTGLSRAINIISPASNLLKYEELIPLLGQVSGGALAGLPGSVAGAAVGNALKQGIGIMKGKQKDFSNMDLATDTALTALFEGAARLPAFMAYRRLRAADDLANGAGAELSLAKNALSKVKEAVPIDDVLKPLQEGLDNIAVKSGSQAAQLNKWKLKIESLKKAGEQFIDGNTLIQMEDQLGAVAKFAKEGGRQEIKNVAANSLAKFMRNHVSNLVDDFAKSQGMDYFPKLSKQVSKLIKISSKKTNSLIDTLRGGAIAGVIGTAAGSVTHNPLVGAAAFGLSELASNSGVQKLAYQGLEKTGLGRAATVGATQLGRSLLE